MNNRYSREDEANLPDFNSHDEAREFFKKKHGDYFQLSDSHIIEGKKIYFYRLIINEKKYNELIQHLIDTESNNFSSNDDMINMLNSYQNIEIWEDGNIHIVH